MGKGRKKTPTAILKLRGSRNIHGNELELPAAIPECPEYLEGDGRKEWFRVVAILSSVGVLSEADQTALAMYCVSFQRYIESIIKLKKMGSIIKSPTGYPIQNPYLAIANKAQEQVLKYQMEFGLTPSSRAKIPQPTKQPTNVIEGKLNFFNEG